MDSPSPAFPTSGSKPFSWSAPKDAWLRAERGVGFEQVVDAIRAGDLLDVAIRSGPSRHAGQRILVVRIGDYAWLVPFVENEREFFLKTIIPSRKATRKHIERSRPEGRHR
jgi:hypothetical protein